MEQVKKFISPGAWFSMNYPAAWSEFEDTEESFLFYNPDEWTGNFRISACKGLPGFGQRSVSDELRENPGARPVRVGGLSCAYSQEMFEEDGAGYVTHLWITGIDDIAFECSFTVARGGATAEAEGVIASLQVRKEGVKYPAEVIPVRISEICQINDAYEWVANAVKETLKKDFQGMEDDLDNMQALVDGGTFTPKKKHSWLALGIVLCVIMTNEMDGLEWRTLIDGNREAPVLLNLSTGQYIDPMKLVWSKVRAGEKVDLKAAYGEAMD